MLQLEAINWIPMKEGRFEAVSALGLQPQVLHIDRWLYSARFDGYRDDCIVSILYEFDVFLLSPGLRPLVEAAAQRLRHFAEGGLSCVAGQAPDPNRVLSLAVLEIDDVGKIQTITRVDDDPKNFSLRVALIVGPIGNDGPDASRGKLLSEKIRTAGYFPVFCDVEEGDAFSSAEAAIVTLIGSGMTKSAPCTDLSDIAYSLSRNRNDYGIASVVLSKAMTSALSTLIETSDPFDEMFATLWLGGDGWNIDDLESSWALLESFSQDAVIRLVCRYIYPRFDQDIPEHVCIVKLFCQEAGCITADV